MYNFKIIYIPIYIYILMSEAAAARRRNLRDLTKLGVGVGADLGRVVGGVAAGSVGAVAPIVNIVNVEKAVDFLIKVVCSPVSFPFGMIHSLVPMSICRPSSVSISKEGVASYNSSKIPTSSIGDSNSAILEGKSVMAGVDQEVVIDKVINALKKFSQSSRISISANQTADIHCPTVLLDNNEHMRRMVDVRPRGEDIWKPAMINLDKCSNGERLNFVNTNDSCDRMEWNNGTITDKGGYIVTYYDGTIERGVREIDEDGTRNIRWIYGCCPVVNQKIQVKITQIDVKNEELMNTIMNEIDISNKVSAEAIGCSQHQIDVSTTIDSTKRLNLRANIEQEINQANEQTIIAAQNIKYTDHYQMCFRGEPRELKQEIDTRVLSMNIIDSAIKFTMENNVSLKATASASIVYESYTPRIFVFSFLFNLVVIGACIKLIQSWIRKM